MRQIRGIPPEATMFAEEPPQSPASTSTNESSRPAPPKTSPFEPPATGSTPALEDHDDSDNLRP